MVLADSPPLALAASHAANRPSCLITNLVWDHVYTPYLEMVSPELKDRYHKMIQQVGS